MALFFIDVYDGHELASDSMGLDCNDLDEALEEALIAARDHLGTLLKEGKAIEGYAFRIRDESGFMLGQIDVAEALRHLPRDIPQRENPHGRLV